MSMELKHDELGWLDEFAKAALPEFIALDHSPADAAARAYRYALAMIERRRTVLREQAR